MRAKSAGGTSGPKARADDGTEGRHAATSSGGADRMASSAAWTRMAPAPAFPARRSTRPVSPGMIAGRGPRRARRNAPITRLPSAPNGVVTSTSGNGPFHRSTTVTPAGSMASGISASAAASASCAGSSSGSGVARAAMIRRADAATSGLAPPRSPDQKALRTPAVPGSTIRRPWASSRPITFQPLPPSEKAPGIVGLREARVEPADLLAVGRDRTVVAPAAEHAEELLPVRAAEGGFGRGPGHQQVAVGRGEALRDQMVEHEGRLVRRDRPERPETAHLVEQHGAPGPAGPGKGEQELLGQHVVRPRGGGDRLGLAPRGGLDRPEREDEVGGLREHEREPRRPSPPPAPAEPLEERGDRGRRTELDHEVEVADIDPELQGRGAGDAERVAGLGRVLGRLPHGRRDRGVVAVERLEAALEQGREPFHLAPRRGEDEGAAAADQPDDLVGPARLLGLDREREPPRARGSRELDELLAPVRSREPGQHVGGVADRGREADPLHGPACRAVEPVEHGPHLDPSVRADERVDLVDHDVPQRPEPPRRCSVVEQDLERLGGDEEDVGFVVGVPAALRGRDVAVERGGREPAREAEPLDPVELVVDQGLERREVDTVDAGCALFQGSVHDRDQGGLGLAPRRRRDHEEVGAGRRRPAGLLLERAERGPAEPLEQGQLERAVKVVVGAGHWIQVRLLPAKG